jgi:hypothetical protein
MRLLLAGDTAKTLFPFQRDPGAVVVELFDLTGAGILGRWWLWT